MIYLSHTHTRFPQPRKFYFPGQSIQDLKAINQDTCEKAYHSNSMYDQLLTFLWYRPPPQAFDPDTFI